MLDWNQNQNHLQFHPACCYLLEDEYYSKSLLFFSNPFWLRFHKKKLWCKILSLALLAGNNKERRRRRRWCLLTYWLSWYGWCGSAVVVFHEKSFVVKSKKMKWKRERIERLSWSEGSVLSSVSQRAYINAYASSPLCFVPIFILLKLFSNNYNNAEILTWLRTLLRWCVVVSMNDDYDEYDEYKLSHVNPWWWW